MQDQRNLARLRLEVLEERRMLSVSPVVTGITRVAGSQNPTNAAVVQFNVAFDDAIQGIDTSDFVAPTTGSVTGASISSVVPDVGNSYIVTVATGSGDGTIGLNLVDDDTITKLGDPTKPLGGVGLGNGSVNGPTYTIDRTPPSVSGISLIDANPTNSAVIHFQVAFSEPILVGVDPSDFTLSTTGVSGASISAVSGSGATYVVTVLTGAGSGTIGLNLVDDDTIVDAVGLPLGGAGAGNGSVTGPSYTIDRSSPIVSSITRVDANPSNASTVRYEVTFSESVTGVDAADFSVAFTGIASASVTAVSGSGAAYTVTIAAGSGNGTLHLDLVDDDSIIDLAGNKLGGTGTGNGNFTGQAYSLDRTPPVVSEIVQLDPATTNLSTVHYSVKFSESVSGVGPNDFSLTTAILAGALITGVTGSGDTYTITVDTGVGAQGTLQLRLVDDDSIRDAAGNALGGNGNGNGNAAGGTYTLDRTPPAVAAINRLDPTPSNLSTVHFSVFFQEAVTGVDVTDFAIETVGLAGASIVNVVGSGNSYTVTVTTGVGEGSLGLQLVDDDSIVDQVGNPLGGAGASNGNFSGQQYVIDHVPPIAVSIVTADTSPTNAVIVHYTVTFGEAVVGVDSADFALSTAGVSGAAITNIAGNGSVYTVTVNTGSGNGTVGLNLVDNDSIVDLAGNALGGPGAGNGNLTGPTYTIDRSGPVVSSIVFGSVNPTNQALVSYLVTFTDSVTGVDLSDFGIGTSGVSGAQITGVTGSGNSYTVTIDTGTGDGSITLFLIDNDSITDSLARPLGGAGTGNGDFVASSYNVDKTPPVVSSIMPTDRSPTGNHTVHFSVRFTESVSGVDASDFVLQTSGVALSFISGVTGSGDTYQVTVDGVTGNGTLGLDLEDDDSILDLAGNPLGGSGLGNGSFTGSVVAIDQTTPSVLSIALADANSSSSDTVHYLVTFSESVSGVDATDFAMVVTGAVGASIASISGSGAAYTVAVNTGTGNGTIGLNFVDNDSVLDTAGNPVAGATSGDFIGSVYTIDKGAPAVLAISRLDANPSTASIVHYLVTFSDNVSGVDESDFSLVHSAGIVGPAILSVAGSGAIYQVAIDSGAGAGTLALSLVDNDSIQDAIGKPLSGVGSDNGNVTGPEYTFNRPPVAGLTPWRNPQFALDVNHDGFVTPSDAVIVINRLLTHGIETLPPPDPNPPTFYYDTNGNNTLSPADALVIINRLLHPTVVTIDTLVPFTVDVTPQIQITVTSPATIPDGTQVTLDIDLNGDGRFDGPGELARTVSSLYSGKATFSITPALPLDNPIVGPYKINLRAHVIDSDGVEGVSPVTPLIVDTMTSDALANYVHAVDPSYGYVLVNTYVDPSGLYSVYTLDMTSQTWRTAADVNRTAWHHWVQVVVPTSVVGTTSLLLIDGGSNTASPPTGVNSDLIATALASHNVVVDLHQVPNESLTFTGDPNNPRSEDSIIAYSFDQYMDHLGEPGNETWPVLVAMTKAAVRAMDTVQSFVPGVVPGTQVNDFVVTGYSKRGWTTWLTAAVDDRVRAIIPGVFDNLNQGPQMVHHYGVYGFFSPAVQPYTDLDIFSRIASPEGEQISRIVDPYRYLNNGHFEIPKLIINSAGDQFFVSDSAQFYFHDLPGTENYLRYLPNTNHGLDERAAESTSTFYDAVVNNRPLPQFSWTVEPDGTIAVHATTAPSQVLLWQITNPDARDFRKDYISPSLVWTSSILASAGGGEYLANPGMPSSGATAFFVELTFPSTIPGNPFVFTTEIHVNTNLPLYPWPYPVATSLLAASLTDSATADLNASASALAVPVQEDQAAPLALAEPSIWAGAADSAGSISAAQQAQASGEDRVDIMTLNAASVDLALSDLLDDPQA